MLRFIADSKMPMVRVKRHLIFVQITSQNFSRRARSQVNSAGILHADLKATMVTTRLQHELLPLGGRVVNLRAAQATMRPCGNFPSSHRDPDPINRNCST